MFPPDAASAPPRSHRTSASHHLHPFYPVLLPITIICILINAVVSSLPSVFMQNIIAVVENTYKAGDWGHTASVTILELLAILIVMYVISLIAGILYTQFMAVITQGTPGPNSVKRCLTTCRICPSSTLDTHNHGDIMSFYTNDIGHPAPAHQPEPAPDDHLLCHSAQRLLHA